MRIITGIAKGIKLKAPKGLDVRPTADRVKGSLFNILANMEVTTGKNAIIGAKVLDLFSGTGNLGLEALSRGAECALFIDHSLVSLATTKENISHTNLAPALVSGFFEIDLGTLAVSQAAAPLVEKVAIASAIIAWSGLSVHGQVASIVIESGIRMTPYIAGRLLHAVLAAILTILLLNSGQSITKLLVIPASLTMNQSNNLSFWLNRLEQATYQIIILLSILIVMSIATHLLMGIYRYAKK